MGASHESRVTLQKLLSRASALLQNKGFNALTFQELADAIGIRKASVHHYFSTKQDLATALIKDYQDRFVLWSKDVEGLEVSEKLEAYFAMIWAISAKGKNICPGGALSLDWKSLSEEAQGELQKFLALHQNFLKQLLEEGRRSKKFSGVGESVDALASMLGASLQGTLQLARMSADPKKHFDKIVAELRGVLGVQAGKGSQT